MNSTSNWDHYRAFLAVMREGSLTAAAQTLDSSAPTVGRHIEALEASLGLPLFTRSPSGLSPTSAALEIEPHAHAMAQSAAALIRVASGAKKGDSGTVRITASEIMAIEVMPPFLASFREQHGEIDLELAVTNQTEDLLRRDADIAVRMVRPIQDALIAQRLGSVTIALFAHRRYLERHGMPSSIDTLRQHTLIGFDRGTLIPRLAERIGITLSRDEFALRTDNDVAQIAALRAGFGIGGCQVPIARKDPMLVPVLPETVRFDLEVWLVMHRDQRSVRRVRILYDHLAAELGTWLRG
jgi:DNA-binding transcriptional LysR family regulator